MSKEKNQQALNDTRRKIAEVMKKQDSKLTFGWTPTQVERHEGEVWEDTNGKKWTKKNGLIQSISKLDGMKTPWWCPKCGTPLNGHHLRAYKKAGHCHECMLKEEMELKISGRWFQAMVERGKRSHIDWVKDRIQELQDYHDNISQPEFIHADNEKILMIEKWNVDLDTVKKDLLEEINKLKEHLTKVEAGEFDEQPNS
jgi:RNA polymerase-binding transcription factor DksA